MRRETFHAGEELVVPIIVVVPWGAHMIRLERIRCRVLHGLRADERDGKHRDTAWGEDASNLGEGVEVAVHVFEHM